MYLGITQETRIMDLQKEFNTFYPYLKLEFFKTHAPRNKILQKAEKIYPHELVQCMTHQYKQVSIHVDYNRTVAQIVVDFREILGLSILVFRKSGNLWIETSLTDSWSLERQNKIGESFSNLPNSY